jgi:hypothetical protein
MVKRAESANRGAGPVPGRAIILRSRPKYLQRDLMMSKREHRRVNWWFRAVIARMDSW